MKTKQLRLSGISQISSRLSDFVGKKINIVFKDSSVVFGELKSANDKEILILNMRQKKISYPLAKIAELYVDTVVQC